MKMSVTENDVILLEEVFNSITLKTTDGEEMSICMRDSGFEFKYQGEHYTAKEGRIDKTIFGYTKGDRINHKRFGDGTISEIDGEISKVKFDSGIEKELLTQFAQYKRI